MINNPTPIEIEIRKRDMQRWADRYPFAAVMMSGLPLEEKLIYAEGRFRGVQKEVRNEI